MKKYHWVKKKRLFFRFIAFWVRRFYRRSEFIGLENIPNEPCVFLGNHSQMHTPVMAECYFPVNKLTWCDAPMFDKKEMKAYAYRVFWGDNPTWFQRFLAKILCPLVAYIMNNADALPVYRDMRVVKTYKFSVDELEKGNSIVILPECPDEHNEIINKLNEYFVDVARFYFKRTAKELYFTPFYYAPKLKKTVIGKPIKFDTTVDIEQERKRICDYTINEISSIAKTLPSHVVIPFNTVPKQQYKKSK